MMTKRTMTSLWEEVERDRYVPIYNTPTSRITILNGYKIVKMNDGDVIIYNTRGSSDFYKEISSFDEVILLRNGIIKGTHILSIDYLEMKLEAMNKSIQHLMNSGRDQSLAKARSTRSEILNKITYFGFKHATHAGITISSDDLVIPSTKKLYWIRLIRRSS